MVLCDHDNESERTAFNWGSLSCGHRCRNKWYSGNKIFVAWRIGGDCFWTERASRRCLVGLSALELTKLSWLIKLEGSMMKDSQLSRRTLLPSRWKQRRHSYLDMKKSRTVRSLFQQKSLNIHLQKPIMIVWQIIFRWLLRRSRVIHGCGKSLSPRLTSLKIQANGPHIAIYLNKFRWRHQNLV